jgi:hypothetical protein
MRNRIRMQDVLRNVFEFVCRMNKKMRNIKNKKHAALGFELWLVSSKPLDKPLW